MRRIKNTTTMIIALVMMLTLLTPVTGKVFAGTASGAVPKGNYIVTLTPPSGYTGWVKRGDYYYFYYKGTPLKGWQKVNGTWYILNGTTGALYRVISQVNLPGGTKVPKATAIVTKYKITPKYTGWVLRGQYYYHYYKGNPMKGVKKINGTWYDLNATSGALAWVIGDDIDRQAHTRSSRTENLIMVSYSDHRVRVYEGYKHRWKRIKDFSCTLGARSTRTPRGEYTIKSRGKFFNTGSIGRCWYWTQFYGNYLFHSVIYNRNSSPNHIIDGRLGINASHGCIRLKLKNARWIYNNIPRRTKVVIY